MQKNEDLNIVLVGMPGAGKSYIGKKLAKLLAHFSFVDTDEEIEKSTGKTITEIFEQESEKKFRTLESEIIKEIATKKNQIISIGGGAFENDDNIKALKRTGLVFYLKTPVSELYQRIKDETHRPLLQAEDPVKILKSTLRKREPNFLKANFIVETYNQTAYALIDKIIGEYENYARKNYLR